MLRVSHFSQPSKSLKADLLVVAITPESQKKSEKKPAKQTFQRLSKQTNDLLENALGKGWESELHAREFKAKGFSEAVVFRCQHEQLRYVLFVGSSKPSTKGNQSHNSDAPVSSSYKQLGHSIGAHAIGLKAESVAILADTLTLDSVDAQQGLIEGLSLSSYKTPTFKKSQPKSFSVQSVALQAGNAINSAVVKRGQATASAITQARDWVNLPASHCTPSFFVKEAKRIAKTPGLRITVLDQAKLKQLKAGGILGVNAGSKEPPALVKISYKPSGSGKKVKKVAIVGKGVMFDSGGYSLKPAAGMMTMKCDMAGAAAVLATMQAIAALKPKIEVHCYIPIVENMVNSNALRPGDIIHLLGGKSVEVLNTDAEGRLILADALTLAVKDSPDVIIDLATLTGACVAALGPDYAGIFSNNDALAQGLIDAGHGAGENLWRLPLAKEYRKLLDSPVADLKNIGGSYGGAITAALFLKEFVGDLPWAHLDIAGPAFLDSASGILPRGGSGFGVATLVNFICS
jgi:leucyl aminopeptidase